MVRFHPIASVKKKEEDEEKEKKEESYAVKDYLTLRWLEMREYVSLLFCLIMERKRMEEGKKGKEEEANELKKKDSYRDNFHPRLKRKW